MYGWHPSPSPINAASLAQHTFIRHLLWDSHPSGQWSDGLNTADPRAQSSHNIVMADCMLIGKHHSEGKQVSWVL